MKFATYIYQNEKYQIDIQLLNKYTNDEILIEAEETYMPLVEEYESHPKLSREEIDQFFKYFETEEIELNNKNILSIKYLSNKFKIPTLNKMTNEYIDNNYKSILDEFFLLMKDINQNKMYEENYYYQENLLSDHISEYFIDSRLPSLPINILYRILTKYRLKTETNLKKTNNLSKINNNNNFTKKSKSKSKNKPKKSKIKSKTKPKSKLKNKKKSIKYFNNYDDDNDEEEIYEDINHEQEQQKEDNSHKIIDLLIETVKRQGIQSMILFNIFEFDQEGLEYLIEQIDEMNTEIEIDNKYLTKKSFDF